MKRTAFAILSVMILLSLGTAWAGDLWTCPGCGASNDGNYCVYCGTERPSGAYLTQAADPGQVYDLTGVGGSTLLELTVDFEENMVFSTYDVVMYLDSAYLITLPHGTGYHGYLSVQEGPHVLTFCEDGDPDVAGAGQFYVEGETAYTCRIQAKNGRVKVSDEGQGAPFEAASGNAQRYMAACAAADAEAVVRDPEKARDGRVALTGTVLQVIEGWFDTVTLLAADGDGCIWYVVYPTAGGTVGVRVNDRVSLYGLCSGVTTYFTVSGDLAAAPSMEAQYILLQ